MAWKDITKYPWYYIVLLVVLFFFVWHGILHFEEHRLKKKMAQLSSQFAPVVAHQLTQTLMSITSSHSRAAFRWFKSNDYFKVYPSVERIFFHFKQTELTILNPYLSSEGQGDPESVCFKQEKRYKDPMLPGFFITIKGHYLCVFNEKKDFFALFNLTTFIQASLKTFLNTEYYLFLVNQTALKQPLDQKQLVHRQWLNVYGVDQYYELFPNALYWESLQREAFFMAFLCVTSLFILLLVEIQRQLMLGSAANRQQRMEWSYLEQLAFYDQLTQLPNRKYFFSELARWMTLASQDNRYFTFCFLDCDHFKQINDHYGHLIGDKVLAYIAQTIFAEIRQDDFFARVSGDEFCLLLSNCINCNHVERVAKKIIQLFDTPFNIEGCTIQMSVSIGCLICDDLQSLPLNEELLFEQADKLMYLAKKETCGYFILNQNKNDVMNNRHHTPLLPL